MFYRFIYTIENLLSKMYIEGALMRKSRNIALIMVTIISHIFINIFQMVDFTAVKFTRGNEKNMSFLLIPKSHQKASKKSQSIGLGSFKLCVKDPSTGKLSKSYTCSLQFFSYSSTVGTFHST